MIQASEEFREAIVGSPRRIELYMAVDISDPDKRIYPPTTSQEAPWSRPEQLNDYEFDPPPRYATLERNRWILDGSYDLFPDDYQVPQRIGFATQDLCGDDGVFDPPLFAQVNFDRVRVLQGCAVFFSADPADGVAEDFTVEVFYRGEALFTQEFTGNRAAEIQIRGFTIYDPNAIKVTVQKWSIPRRRVRLVEIVIGIYERWNTDMLAAFNVTLQGQFSDLSLPYGTARLTIDNADRRFEPRRKDSIFKSIEERQGVDILIGCHTPYGIEKIKIGLFYQAEHGWATSTNDLTINWNLVDIIGLLTNRTFIVPDVLPNTLDGWMQALVLQLGENFSLRYHVDPDYADKPVVAYSRDDVTGKKCGDIIRWVCQASGTWPRADQTTGRLTAEPLWNQGNKLTLDNMNTYPEMKANETLAALIFQLYVPDEAREGEQSSQRQEFVVSGNSTTSEKTITIINPFLHTEAQALDAARLILSQYGGWIYNTVGRGDPTSEIGDVDTIWLDESNAATARRMMQEFQIQQGVLQRCRSQLLQADGSYLWTEFVVFDADGEFDVPEDVDTVRVVIGQGGQGGGMGQDGQWESAGSSNIEFSGLVGVYGQKGVDGQGGKIWYGVVNVNPGTKVHVHLGRGGDPGPEYGKPGKMGEHSTFGQYSSENGRLYPNGYTDIANGQAFARTGVEAPLSGTGDGGAGGAGGDPGYGHIEVTEYTPEGSTATNTKTEWIVDKEPGPGHPGVRGGDGFVMVTWEKPHAVK